MDTQPTLDWWSSWSDRLGITVIILGALVAAVTVVGWYFSYKSGNLKEAKLKQFQKNAEVEIAKALETAADANKVAALANQGQAKANEAAAKANERTAMLEKEAADAKLEVEKMKETLSWRTIPHDRIQKFAELLSKISGSTISVLITSSQPEVRRYAYQFQTIFNVLKIDCPHVFRDEPLFEGECLWIEPSIANTNESLIAQKAFEFIGIPVTHPSGMPFGFEYKDGIATPVLVLSLKRR